MSAIGQRWPRVRPNGVGARDALTIRRKRARAAGGRVPYCSRPEVDVAAPRSIDSPQAADDAMEIQTE